ncbi:MAG TPA: galactokinase family protein [Acidimicrobiales bacterium]|nr:galactokinase family protein [Acidimicrobiales bacterium]
MLRHVDAPEHRRLGISGTKVRVRAEAPARVNLIGDHTDYAGGYVLPMAIDRSTTVDLRRHGDAVEMVSAGSPRAAHVPLGITEPEAPRSPDWSRYVAGVVVALRPHEGGSGVMTSTVPPGAGLSSSSALTVAVALALGFEGTALELARLCQRAETLGSGVPGGIMDQLCSAAATAGHALLIDCTTLAVRPVAVPDACEVIVAHCGVARSLVGSAYADRRRDVELAAAELGPLGVAGADAWTELADPLLRRRARHVISENARVLACAAALDDDDPATAGHLMSESHASLREDFNVSTADLDSVVAELQGLPGAYGARLTGAGFGGCAVALAEAGTLQRAGGLPSRREAWVVRAVDGATVTAVG